MLKPGDIIVYTSDSFCYLVVKTYDDETESRHGNKEFVFIDLYSLTETIMFWCFELSLDDHHPKYPGPDFKVYRDGKLFGKW